VSGESGPLRSAVERLLEAQREALEVTKRALDAEGEEERPGVGDRLEGALVDVQDILEGAQEDVRDLLGDEA
jgi:hypothetical protein